MSELFVGTSGWVYGYWEGIFYPEDLPSKDKLKYFSQYFKTTEINYSFYHLPRPSTYQNWYKQTPADFIFAVKASRFITHIKKLSGVNPVRSKTPKASADGETHRTSNGVKDAWKTFLENALNLKEKLGPILFQFPPSFKATEENIKRLENFLGDRPRQNLPGSDPGKFSNSDIFRMSLPKSFMFIDFDCPNSFVGFLKLWRIKIHQVALKLSLW